MRARGFTLVEAIIASFVLVTAFLLIARLFHSGLRYTTQVERRVVAAHLAQKRMAELRRWARTPAGAGFEYDRWSSPPDGSDAEHPDYALETQVTDAPLSSPSESLEAAHPGDPRRLPGGARQVRVTVSWGDNGTYSLVSLVGVPLVEWSPSQPLRIDGSPPPLIAAGASVPFTVAARDSDGRPIDDLTFRWYVEPITTLGTVNASRDGRRATFVNQLQLADGTYTSAAGRCRLVVRSRLGGIDKTASQELNLAE